MHNHMEQRGRVKIQKVHETIQDYLELFKIRCEPGTTAAESRAAENQLVLAKKKGNYTIRLTLNTRGKCIDFTCLVQIPRFPEP
jgi:hypothetical protein